MPLARKPGMITLHGGMPNPSTFPFASMAITLTDGSVLNLEGADVRLRWVAPVAIAPHVGSLLYCLNSLTLPLAVVFIVAAQQGAPVQ